jgi:hypothetical protein
VHMLGRGALSVGIDVHRLGHGALSAEIDVPTPGRHALVPPRPSSEPKTT